LFYGHKIHSGVQTGGDTLYMPNYIHHSVFNLEENVAVGDNYLYASSFEELVPQMEPQRLTKLLSNMENDSDKERIKAVMEQIKKAAKKKLKQGFKPKKLKKIKGVSFS
jgi:ribosomal protein L16 Arg81 hydroxylase